MKRLEVTVPKGDSKKVEDILEEYSEETTSSEVKRGRKKLMKFELTVDSEHIDAVTKDLKGMKELESGDLVIDVLEETALIEKGKRREGGSSSISVQEMYTKAFEFAAFDKNSWALIALASGIAVLGAVMNNVMVVIGAMVIAPMLGPFISLSFGLVIGDRRLIRDSVFYGILSMLFGIAVSFLFALLIQGLKTIEVTAVMRLVAEAGFATIPLSLLVGGAAALTFTTEMRESLAGVAVAIALVPPAAIAGMTLAMLRFDLFFEVSLVLLSNVSSLILAGSITFKLSGITPSTYYRKKVSKEELRNALILSIAAIVVIGGIVGVLSYRDLQTEHVTTTIDEVIEDRFGDAVLRKQVETVGGSPVVTLTVVNPDMTATELESALSTRTNQDVTVKLIAVNGTVVN